MASSNTNTPAPDAGSELFDEAVACIAQEGRISFEPLTILRRRLGSICRRADKEVSTIRVLVTGVKEEALGRALSSFRFGRNLRVWLEDESGHGAAILTFSPSVTHEVARRQFFIEILERVSRIPSHDLHCLGRRSKEGDDGIICATRAGGNAWPNVMTEVGYSEPVQQLRLDAKWWLLNSGGRTNFGDSCSCEEGPKELSDRSMGAGSEPKPEN